MTATWSYPVLKDTTGKPIIVGVHDGDTCRLALDQGLETAWFPWLRVKGLFCPELAEPGGHEAREFTAQTLAAARDIRVTVFGRSFARWVSLIEVDNIDLAGIVIAAGHGTATAS